MRRRLTWNSFNQWLLRQKNTREVHCKDSKCCPIAVYVKSTFGGKSASVYGHKDITIVTEDGSYVSLHGPKKMSTFIKAFDDLNTSSIAVAKEVARKINRGEIKNA